MRNIILNVGEMSGGGSEQYGMTVLIRDSFFSLINSFFDPEIELFAKCVHRHVVMTKLKTSPLLWPRPNSIAPVLSPEALSSKRGIKLPLTKEASRWQPSAMGQVHCIGQLTK